MTPGEKKVLRSLVAVAWADGKMAEGESGVIEGLLCGFDASDEEEEEILEFAKTRRTLEDDVPLADLTAEDRELLLSNAALLTQADGDESAAERTILHRLAKMLGFDASEVDKVLASTKDGVLNLGTKTLED
jgi:tellurite resistance protein